MKTTRPVRFSQSEQGMVLVAALMVMAVLAVLCAAGISASSLEVQIAGHDRAAKQSLFLCDAGLGKARYDALNGWGVGTASGSTSPYTFTFDDSNPLFSAAQPLWAYNKWVNFTFMDSGGGLYTVTGNSSVTSNYALTLTTAGTTAPVPGRGSLYYYNPWMITTLSWNSGTTVQGGLNSNLWNNLSLAGYYLVDRNGVSFDIQSSISNSIPSSNDATITVGGTVVPAAGSCEIRSALAGSGTFTMAQGIPNTQWTAAFFGNDLWYLVDATTRNIFRIRVASQSGNRTTLTLSAGTGGATTPTTGPFELTTNPWLAPRASGAVAAPTYSANGTSSDFLTPGKDYGTVTVATTSSAGGKFTLVATSGSSGDQRQLSLDGQLRASGGVSFSNWREVTP